MPKKLISEEERGFRDDEDSGAAHDAIQAKPVPKGLNASVSIKL